MRREMFVGTRGRLSNGSWQTKHPTKYGDIFAYSEERKVVRSEVLWLTTNTIQRLKRKTACPKGSSGWKGSFESRQS
jgi:hypothetical protein